MKRGQFSLSAVGAAAHRAMHQKIEGGAIFLDPFAPAILDEIELRNAEKETDVPANRAMRMFMAARSRFAEDSISEAVARGVRQVVVLGAGLDTFSVRNPYADAGLEVFEVDYPETQALKKARIERISPRPNSAPRFVPVDFESQNLREALIESGFDDSLPTFFMWLGVVPYLTIASIRTTLSFIAERHCSEVVFDYSEPLENYEPERRSRMAIMGKRLADLGEPWVTHFDPPALAKELHREGFVGVDDLNLSRISERYLEAFERIIPPSAGPHVVYARNFNPQLA
jgi:methyltransferase (TIGR00027 family)